MTDDEREKLIEEMVREIYEETMNYDYSFDYVKEVVLDAARAALAIAEAAFEKKIKEAYIEGFSCANEMIIRAAQDHEAWDHWYSSRSFASLRASIPEKNDDRSETPQ